MATKSFQLSDKLADELYTRAAEIDRSVSWCIRQAIEYWLRSCPRQNTQ